MVFVCSTTGQGEVPDGMKVSFLFFTPFHHPFPPGQTPLATAAFLALPASQGPRQGQSGLPARGGVWSRGLCVPQVQRCGQGISRALLFFLPLLLLFALTPPYPQRLEVRLQQLGARLLVRRADCDDQHPLGCVPF